MLLIKTSMKSINKSFLKISIFLLGISTFWACSDNTKERLPILGNKEVVPPTAVGQKTADTVYHTIPDFRFLNQDSIWITPRNFQGSVYVADFFFTSCPDICPKMKTQMLRVYDKFKGNPEVKFLSHTIDPEHDSVAVLKDFAQQLGVEGDQWQFVTGDKEKIFEIGGESYMIIAKEDTTQANKNVHSGHFILIDKDRRIRGYYDGTDKEEVDKLIKDIPKLLAEYEKPS